MEKKANSGGKWVLWTVLGVVALGACCIGTVFVGSGAYLWGKWAQRQEEKAQEEQARLETQGLIEKQARQEREQTFNELDRAAKNAQEQTRLATEEAARSAASSGSGEGAWGQLGINVWDSQQPVDLREWVMLTRVLEDFKTQRFVAPQLKLVRSQEQLRMLTYVKQQTSSERNRLVARLLLGEEVGDADAEAMEANQAGKHGEYGSILGMKHLFNQLRHAAAAEAYEAYAVRLETPRTLADAALAKGILKNRQWEENLSNAADLADKALQKAGKQRNWDAKDASGNHVAISLAVMAKYYKEEDKGSESLDKQNKWLEEAHDQWEKQGNKHGMAWCDMERGQLIRNRDGQIALPGTLKCYDRAQATWTRAQWPALWARVEAYRGDAYDHDHSDSGRLKTIEIYQRAASALTIESDPHLYGALYHRIGNEAANMTDFDKTERRGLIFDSYARAQEAWTRDQTPGLWATVNQDAADVWGRLETGDRAENLWRAAKLSEEAGEVCNEHELWEGAADSFSNAGFYYASVKDFKDVESTRKGVAAHEKALLAANATLNTRIMIKAEVDLAMTRLGLSRLSGKDKRELLAMVKEGLNRADGMDDGKDEKMTQRIRKLRETVESEARR